MLKNNCKVVSLLLMGGFWSPLSWGCDCLNSSFIESVKQTRSLIVKEVPIDQAKGVLIGNRQYACALLSFDISDDGLAEHIEAEVSYPDKAINAVAIRALSQYRFKSSRRDAGKHHLVFELSLDKDR